MATYYVDSVNGNDAAAGSEVAPWKTPTFGLAKAVAGDTVIISAPKTSPYRGLFRNFPTYADGTDGNLITFKGASPTDRAYISGCMDVSQGAVISNLLPNPGFEAWETSLLPHAWAVSLGGGSNIVQQETALKVSGESSLAIKRDGGDYAVVSTTLYLPAATPMTLSLQYRSTQAEKGGGLDLWDRTGNVHLNPDGSWATGYIGLGDSVGAWTQKTYNFTTNLAGRYDLRWTCSKGGYFFYIDDASLTFNTSCTWVSTGDGDGRTYALAGKLVAYISLLKCTAANWATDGCNALRPIPKAADVAACKSTPGTWTLSSDVAYYHLAAGESISDLHLEAALPTTAVGGGIEDGQIRVLHDYQFFENLVVCGSRGPAIYVVDTQGSILRDVKAMCGGSHNFLAVAGSKITSHDGEFCWSAAGDGIDADTVGTELITHRSKIHHNWDEGTEAYLAATVKHYFPEIYENGQNGDAGSEGAASLDSGSTMEIYDGLIYGNQGAGVAASTSGCNLVMKNTIVFGNGYRDVNATVGANLDCSYNCYGSSRGEWDALGGEGTGTIVGSDPLLTDPDNGDFTLQSGSPCIAAGIAIAGIHDQAIPAIGRNGQFDHFTDRITIGANPYPEPNRIVTANYSPIGTDVRGTADSPALITADGADITVDLSGLTNDEYIDVYGVESTVLVPMGDNQRIIRAITVAYDLAATISTSAVVEQDLSAHLSTLLTQQHDTKMSLGTAVETGYDACATVATETSLTHDLSLALLQPHKIFTAPARPLIFTARKP